VKRGCCLRGLKDAERIASREAREIRDVSRTTIEGASSRGIFRGSALFAQDSRQTVQLFASYCFRFGRLLEPLRL
jgi:hypothetical protein